MFRWTFKIMYMESYFKMYIFCSLTNAVLLLYRSLFRFQFTSRVFLSVQHLMGNSCFWMVYDEDDDDGDAVDDINYVCSAFQGKLASPCYWICLKYISTSWGFLLQETKKKCIFCWWKKCNFLLLRFFLTVLIMEVSFYSIVSAVTVIWRMGKRCRKCPLKETTTMY